MINSGAFCRRSWSSRVQYIVICAFVKKFMDVHRESKDLTGKDMRPKEDPKAATSQCHDAERKLSVGS
ncbi:hypothetical protein Tco_0241769 [Tanacetum coccineum]